MGKAGKRRSLAIALSAIALMATVTAVAIEVTLHVAAGIFPRAEAVLFPNRAVEPFIPDAELGSRGNPRFPGHDGNGFRNATVPAKADVVVIGDSHSYGWGVGPQETWVHLAARRTSCRFYSMAVPGYGPLQYALLAQRAGSFRPRLIVVGIYFGNDFFDNLETYRRDPMKYPVPQHLRDAAMKREAVSPLSGETTNFFAAAPTDSASEPAPSSLRYFASQNSALWGFLRAVKNQLAPPPWQSSISPDFREAVAALTPAQVEYSSVFEGASWKTILTSRYRHAAENDEDPRIGVGVWLTQWAAETIDRMAKQNGIDTLFVMLPTKESVFADKVDRPTEHKFFEVLTAEEERIRRRLVQGMADNHLAYVDVAAALRAAPEQPYPINADGHPNAAGHAVIAENLFGAVGACKN